MLQEVKILIVFITLTFPTNVQSVSNFNNNTTNCGHDSLIDALKDIGRMSRDVKFESHESLLSKRKPRLFSFDKDDRDVNINMEFGVPFIQIPTKQTIDGLRTFVYDAMQGQLPKPQFNKHAVALIALFCLGFSGIGYLMDEFNYKQYVQGTAPFFFYNRNPERDSRRDDSYSSSDTINIWEILESFDETLSNYNIDATACVQHSICVRVQESLDNVYKRHESPSKLDKILEGVTRTDWIMEFISGTAIEDAIKTGRSGKSCDKTFSSCSVNIQFVYSGLQDIMKNFV